MRPGTLLVAWAGADRAFRLGIGQWRAIQARCDAGPEVILARLTPVAQAISSGLKVSEAAQVGMAGGFRVDDMREVIFQGLIGGENPDCGPVEAANLVREFVDDRLDFRVNLALAYAIVKASLDTGGGEDLPGKPRAKRGSRRSRTANSASPDSTEAAPS